MKNLLHILTITAFLFFYQINAQDRTIINAANSEISDNLDLRAVASIFGDSRNLSDFERRLNDPNLRISNLDLNEDYQVDYLRVIESVEGRTHLIIIQAVLGQDLYQDVATIEVERNRNNSVQIQVVGNVYMYGRNYIYEPVFFHRPLIYATFWVTNYRPYFSTWYWGYYPSYFNVWRPYPVFRYRTHIRTCINTYNNYYYVRHRKSTVAYNMYRNRRSNAYEVKYPTRSFSYRNANYVNRHELDKKRKINTVGTRNVNSIRSNRNESPRFNSRANYLRKNNSEISNSRRGNSNINSPRNNSDISSPRNRNSKDISPRTNEPRNRINEPRIRTNTNQNTRSRNFNSNNKERNFRSNYESPKRNFQSSRNQSRSNINYNRNSNSRIENSKRTINNRSNISPRSTHKIERSRNQNNSGRNNRR